jgi:hypothetical protein
MMVGDNMTKLSREEEEELVVPEFDAGEIVVVMQIVPTSSCGGRGDQEDTSRAVSGRTAAVVTMGEDCGCLGVHSICFIWKLPTCNEIAPKLQTLALLLYFHLNIHVSFSCCALASASASLVSFDLKRLIRSHVFQFSSEVACRLCTKDVGFSKSS